MKVKTRTEFEPMDFDGCGQMVIRETAGVDCKDAGFMATVSYKIGYMHTSGPNRLFMISLADGMLMEFATELALCLHLNKDPGYRPMTDDEITKVMLSQRNRFPVRCLRS